MKLQNVNLLVLWFFGAVFFGSFSCKWYGVSAWSVGLVSGVAVRRFMDHEKRERKWRSRGRGHH